MSWLRRLINTFRPGRLHRDIDRELSFHIAERADQLQAQGLSAEEAARRARIQFGNPIVQRERTRDVDIAGWVDARRCAMFATRSVRSLAHPGFTADRGAHSGPWHRRQYRRLLRHRCHPPAAVALSRQRPPRPDSPEKFAVDGNSRGTRSSRGLEPAEFDLRGDHWFLHGRRLRDIGRSAGAVTARVCRATLLRGLGDDTGTWTWLHRGRTPTRRAGCGRDQRSILAPAFCRRSRCARQTGSGRGHDGTDRRRDAAILSLS